MRPSWNGHMWPSRNGIHIKRTPDRTETSQRSAPCLCRLGATPCRRTRTLNSPIGLADATPPGALHIRHVSQGASFGGSPDPEAASLRQGRLRAQTRDRLHPMRDEATFTVKAGLAEMLKGGVIMDVVTPEQAKVAEDAGAAAVMALERVPADIRRDGGVARMSDPEMIAGIQEAVSIPVMAKARIGHFVEAQVLEALDVDYVDESEVLTPADEANHIDKWAFKVPFVCGATNLGEALRRIGEGAAMIRSKGEAGTGDIVEAVRHMRLITGEIRRLAVLQESELATAAKAARGAAGARAPASPRRGACRSCCSARAASRRPRTPR